MNAATDLLPIGETYAELDFVVRQLDDGSLTIALDDTLPDESRVRLSATDAGLEASLKMAAAPECTEGLKQAIESLSGTLGAGAVVWEAGSVLRKCILAWAKKFSEAELRKLFDGVQADAERFGPELEKVAAGEKEWDAAAVQDKRARDLRLAGAGLGYEPQEPETRDRPVSVPPSFLPGAGQASDDERATLRYGAVGEVPGRAELPAGERRSGGSFRVERPVQPGGQTPFAVIGVVALMFAIALGGVFVKLTSEDEVATSEPPPPVVVPDTPTPGDEPDGDGGELDEDEDDDSGTMFDPGIVTPTDLGGPSTTGGEPPPKPVERIPSGLSTEAGVLKVAGGPDAEARPRAVTRWLELEMDRKPGARLRMLKALDRRIDSETGLLLLKSFRDHPVEVEEALESLNLANEGIRRLLIEQLAAGQHSEDDAAVIAEMLAEIPDSDDMLIELSLIRLGHPKPGAALRMIEKRGVVWVQLGEGNDLIAKMIARDLAQSKPLATHEDETVRALVCDFLAKTEDPAALAYVTPFLSDAAVKVRRRAIECMASLRSAKASWPLARRLVREEDSRTVEVIRAALSKLPAEETARYLNALLKKTKTSDRLAAVQGLHAMGRTESAPALVRALRDAKPEIQLEALTALRKMHKQPLLADAVSQALSEIRRLALSKTADAKVKKAARQLHYQVAGRFPN